MENIVIYGSNYGHAKKYGEWIGQALSCQVVDYKGIKNLDLSAYKNIIMGGGLYAGGLLGIGTYLDIMKNNKANFILYTVGLADPKNKKNTDSIYQSISQKIPENYLKDVKIFYLRGGIDYKKLNFIHGTMMWLLVKVALRNKKDDEEVDPLIFETYGKEIDFSEKDSIIDLVKYARAL